MGQISFTIIFLGFLTAAFLAWYFIHNARERERIMRIEKGLDIPEREPAFKLSFRFPWLKLGVLITSIAVGLIIGVILSEMIKSSVEYEPIMMFLFGGIGMIIAHYIDRNQK